MVVLCTWTCSRFPRFSYIVTSVVSGLFSKSIGAWNRTHSRLSQVSLLLVKHLLSIPFKLLGSQLLIIQSTSRIFWCIEKVLIETIRGLREIIIFCFLAWGWPGGQRSLHTNIFHRSQISYQWSYMELRTFLKILVFLLLLLFNCPLLMVKAPDFIEWWITLFCFFTWTAA